MKIEKVKNISKEKIILVASCALGLIIIASFISKIISLFPIALKNCFPLSPLALQKLTISTAAPIFGEKCQLTNKDFLIRLIYKDSNNAQQALYDLQINSEGKKENNITSFQGNSVSFYKDQEKIAIIVLLGKNNKQASQTLKRIPEKSLFTNFQIPSVDIAKAQKELIPENELNTSPKETIAIPKASTTTSSSTAISKPGTLPSTWVYSGGEASKGTIELKDDGSFIFTGLKSPDFVSGGKYFFERNILTLVFTEDLDYWQKVFADGDLFTSQYQDILEVKPERYSVTFDVFKCRQLNDNDCINFFNWIFYYQ